MNKLQISFSERMKILFLAMTTHQEEYFYPNLDELTPFRNLHVELTAEEV